MSVLSTCPHVWLDTEVGCDDCGTHPAVRCDECGQVLDLVYEDDPRDVLVPFLLHDYDDRLQRSKQEDGTFPRYPERDTPVFESRLT